MRKELVAVLAALWLAGCQLASPTALPEEFLGLWQPNSKSTAAVGIEITDDGRIKHIFNPTFLGSAGFNYRDSKAIRVDEYKVISIKKDTGVFVLIKENLENGSSYYAFRMFHISFLPNGWQRLSVNSHPSYKCKASQKDWDNFNSSRLINDLNHPNSPCNLGQLAQTLKGATYARHLLFSRAEK